MINQFKSFILKPLKKNLINTFIIILLILLFAKLTNFTNNVYSILFKNYEERFIKSYKDIFFSGYCRKESHGFIFFIKNKYSSFFKKNFVPKIINFDNKRRIPYWIFLKTNSNVDDKYLILLNKNLQNDRNNFSEFDVLENHDNKCYFMVKND